MIQHTDPSSGRTSSQKGSMPRSLHSLAALAISVLQACSAADIPQGSPLPPSGSGTGESEGTESGVMGETLVVKAHGPDGTSDQDLIGLEAEPRWATRRMFTLTRMGTVPDGLVDLEGWFTQDHEKHGNPGFEQLTYELEMGLPWRCQVDLFQVQTKTGRQGTLDPDESGIELDHMLANWGVIPGNPTLHAEYSVVGSDYSHLELGVLLGGSLPERVFWGANLRCEITTGGDREHDWTASGACGYSVSSRLTVGMEGQLEDDDVAGSRGHFQSSVQLGPAIQFRPNARIHLNGECQFGVDRLAPEAVYTVIVGCAL